MSNYQQIKLPEGFDVGQIESALAGSHALRLEEPAIQKLSFYDTFDWRLFGKSLTLHHSEQDLVLRQLPDGEDVLSLAVAPPPVFAQDLPQSPLRERLGSIIDMRALLPLGEITTRSQTYRILNQDEKTVARLVFIQLSIPSTADKLLPDAYLSLRPMLGYPRHARQLAERLHALGESTHVWEELYLLAMHAAGRVPGSYSTKLDLQLDPGMRSDDAARAILRRLLAVMKANEDGIRSDIDTEFLHDYRVAIRRTRAALSQIKGVFPAPAVERFRQDFAGLGELSNELRDLDVYLLSEQEYRDMLPAGVMDDISPLFDYLRSRRPQALRRVIDHLDSPAYARFLAEWEAFLDGPYSPSAAVPHAERPVIDLARERIYRRYRSIIKDGRFLLEHPSDELMHPLRIDCKKLRYLIEFFSSLFPSRSIAVLVSQLKRLQDNLGEFNDLKIQQLHLLETSALLPLSDDGSRRTLVAIGALVKSLADRQQIVRDEFSQTFNSFASPEYQKRYRALFAIKPQGVSDDHDRPVQQ